jgi:hypothetical protein
MTRSPSFLRIWLARRATELVTSGTAANLTEGVQLACVEYRARAERDHQTELQRLDEARIEAINRLRN